jgi:hypothetical protein
MNSGMNIAYLHYHLRTGGVTTVLRQQWLAVRDECETLIFTGLLPDAPFSADIIHMPALAYRSTHEASINPDDVARAIIEAIRVRFRGRCDVLHIHNPTLAKNRDFLSILKSLQKRGITLLLQIHDFAEDGRPLAYFAEEYPENCHYAVINWRDYNILLQAGLTREGLHHLANAIDPPIVQGGIYAENPFVLYPVRAIRRKNIGESILLSLFFKNAAPLVITLPPSSPMDLKSYVGWKAFVKDHHLSVEFDSGLHNDFESMVQKSNFMITTSVTEGFGFAFLEPWLYGKLLWGRNLTDTCRDFQQNGIDFNHLYTELHVPLDWMDYRHFYQKWHGCVLKTCRWFNFQLNEDNVTAAFDSITRSGTIDFGLLDEGSQKQILLRVIRDKNAYRKLMRVNPFLLNPGAVMDKPKLIRKNKAAIEANYNQTQYRQRLMETYQKVSTTPIKQKIDKTVLISAFLNLEKFSLLKWSDAIE